MVIDRLVRALLLAALLALPGDGSAAAEQRLALVIGNSAYARIGSLKNPSEDAALMAASLERTGFATTLALDVSQDRMKLLIATFGRALRRAGSEAVGLFYFAGHGVQASGRNYLMPVDSDPADAADLDLMGVEADWVLRQMESARSRANVIILDACRNSPFTRASRSIGQGLAATFAPTGSFIAYATAPGDVALDGSGRNSPFTRALAEQILVPDLSIEQVFKQVRLRVIRETDGRQTPWDSSSLVTDFFFSRSTAVEAVEAVDPTELKLWETVRASPDPGTLSMFLQAYPASRFAADARSALAAALAAPAGQGAGGTTPGAASGPVASLSMAPSGAVPDPGDTKDPLGPVSFDAPLTDGPDGVIGRSIPELVDGTALFPPLEGLPDAYWKGRACSSCHDWARADLCRQGRFYVGKDPATTFGKIAHPYGGPFKRALLDWAAAGCP